MEVTFIDPEPPDSAGGGIRTYVRLALALCREAGLTGRVYTHNPEAYPGEEALRIGRHPGLPAPFRGLAYRLGYAENVLWEHALWLGRELAATDAPGRVYEFADFQGYAFFALRDPSLRGRCLVRVHTPAFLIPSDAHTARQRILAALSAWRERDCLRRAPCLAAPSAEFMRERLPWLRGWKHVPNPLPPDPGPPPPDSLSGALAERAARRRAAEAAVDPGAPPASGDPAWKAAPPGQASLAEAARAASRPDRLLAARFLYLGRVEPRKGVLPLVRAFARAAAERPLASLTLAGPIGDGAYARAVRDAISAQPPGIRDRIAWEPPCEPAQRAGLFARHSALVVPSLWENSPYVYFEGMAAGLACIGSATGEMKAVARETGAPNPRPGDEGDWAEALRAHCDGKDADVVPAQRAYLAARRPAAADALMESWRSAARPFAPRRAE